jgi:hypothetical protein
MLPSTVMLVLPQHKCLWISLYHHCILVTDWMNVKLCKFFMQKHIKWVKILLGHLLFVLLWQETLIQRGT